MKLEEFLKTDLYQKFGMTKQEAEEESDSRLVALYEIQEILRRPDVNLGRHLECPCPTCQEQQVYCGHYDLGAIDYYDNFWHLCLNCLYAQHIERHGLGSEQDLVCPFC